MLVDVFWVALGVSALGLVAADGKACSAVRDITSMQLVIFFERCQYMSVVTWSQATNVRHRSLFVCTDTRSLVLLS